MKFLMVCLLIIVYGLSVTPILAQQACLVNVACPDGSGSQQCNGIWTGEFCDIINPAEDCLPCSLNPPPRNDNPPSTPESPINNQPGSPQNPVPPNSNPGITTPEVTDGTLKSDEINLLKLNQITTPESVISSIQPKPETLWNSIEELQKASTLKEKLDILTGLFTSILGFKPNSFGMFASRAEHQSQSELPPGVNPEDSHIITETAENLGGKVGVYSRDMPDLIKAQPITTQLFECLYEKSVYPEGIHPITQGQSCN